MKIVTSARDSVLIFRLMNPSHNLNLGWPRGAKVWEMRGEEHENQSFNTKING